MSINFNDVPSEFVRLKMEELFGKPVASDGKTNLFDELFEIDQRDMKALANAAGQPVSVEMNSVGDIKTMDDGTQWRLTPNGWHKLPV